MQRELTAAFIEYLSRNLDANDRRDYYGVRIDGAAANGSRFELTLTFQAGERYCCPEQGCHAGLNDPECWRVLREVLGQHGLADIPKMTVTRFVGIIEPGAVLGWDVPSRKPIVSDGFTYEAGPFPELDG